MVVPRRFLAALGGPLLLAAAPTALEAHASAIASGKEAQVQAHAALATLTEPSPRSTIQWTPAMLRSAEQRADSGNLQAIGDICDWIFGDERFATVMDTRADALFGCDVTFEKGKGVKARAAVRALEAEEDWQKLLPEAEQKQILRWGLTAGVALVHEERTEAPATLAAREVPVFRVWSTRHLRYDFKARQWLVAVVRDGATLELPATAENGFHLFFPYGESRPWKRGLWRGLSRLVLAKQFAISDFAGASELHGRPVWVASKTGAPAIPQHRSDLAAEIAAMGRGSVIVLPEGYELEMVEAAARTWDMFVAQIKIANDAMTIAVLGGNLLTDAGDGAQTGATQQGLNQQKKLKGDHAVWTTWAHDVPLTRWALWNYGTADVAPWPVYDIEPPADVSSQAAAIKGLGEAIAALDAALAKHGLQSDAAELCETYGVPTKPLAEEAPLAPRQPAPPVNDGQMAAVVNMSTWRLGKRRKAVAA